MRRPYLVAWTLVSLAGCGGEHVGGLTTVGPAAPTLDQWRYRADAADAGSAAGWARRPLRMTPVRIPHAANGATAEPRSYAGSVGWYRARLRTARTGPHEVRFASVHHAATVWLDGRHVCSHAGAYVSFSCPVDLRRARAHEMTVRVDWRDPPRQKREGFDRAWFNWGGLHRAVTVVARDPVELLAPRLVTDVRPDGAVRVQVHLAVRSHGMRGRVRVAGRLAGRTLRFAPVTIAPGRAGLARATLDATALRLWSPSRPALHDLVARVPGSAPLRARVGLRELRWSGGRLRLNGRPLRLRGAALPADARGRGDALTGADHAAIVRQLQALGANATRAQMPLDDDLLARLDAAGILVWQEIGPFDPAGAFRAGQDPHLVERAQRRALETVRREAIHPSVVTWSLANEVAGQGHPSGQAAYVASLARQLRRLDPGRPIAVDIWGRHLPRADLPGSLYRHVDALGLTDYVGWYELTGRPRAEQEALVRTRVAALRALFGDKPLVVTETGSGGNRANRRGTLGSERRQARDLAARVRLYEDLPVAGVLVFVLRDYALRPGFDGGSMTRAAPQLRLDDVLNEKGLFRWDGAPKPSAAAVRRAFAARRSGAG